MAERLSEVHVTRNEGRERFEAEVDGGLALLTYAEMDGKLALLHTEVPPELEGRGLGGRLVETALRHARDQGQKVLPFCPFVKTYLERHPEYQDLAAERE